MKKYSLLSVLLLLICMLMACEGSSNKNKGNPNYIDELSPAPGNVRFHKIELIKLESALNTFRYNLKVTFSYDEDSEDPLPVFFLTRNEKALSQWQLMQPDITKGYVLFDIHEEIREKSRYKVVANETETIEYNSASEFNALSDDVPETQDCNLPAPESVETQWTTHHPWTRNFTSIPTDEDYMPEGSCRIFYDAASGIESNHCRPIQSMMPFYFSLVTNEDGSVLLPVYTQVNVLFPDEKKYLKPDNGWPVVLYFHGAGSGLNCEHYHTAGIDYDGNVVKDWQGHHNSEAEAIYALVDAGYAVVLPHAPVGLPPLYHGNWITSVLEDNQPYTLTADYAFLTTLINHIDVGSFDALQNLDGDNMFAAGFSLGGTQSARMTINWPERFNAIAIHNGGPANCLWVGYDDPLFPSDWCENIALPDLSNQPTPILFTHQFEDRNQMIGQSELYAFYINRLNQSLAEGEQAIPWRAVIGRFEQNLSYDWLLSQHPKGMTTHWSDTIEVPECVDRNDIYCVEYVEHVYIKNTYHYVIEEAGETMVDWFNRYKVMN